MNSHALLLYHDRHDLADILRAAPPAADHLVLLACDATHHDELAGVLPGHFTVPAPRPDIHTRPAGAIAEYRRQARRRDARFTATTIIAEPDPGRTAVEQARAARCEAALDLTNDTSDARIVCAYRTPVPKPLLGSLLSTHGVLLTRYGPRPNPGHGDPVSILFRHTTHRPVPPPAAPPVLRIARSDTIQELHSIRQHVAAHLSDVPTLIRTDFVAAVNEILTNGYLHGAPPLELTLWAEGQTIDCRVTDHGTGRPDPTAGYRTADSSGRAGAGLWLARQLCDDIDMWRSNDTFTVRAATSAAPHRNRQHSGAHARAETARVRAALAADRLRAWSTTS
ncbi:ATP-binding protein [Actinoplanes sp. N902-109]|uniref:ATP-binding protein n=1 Tax=Actinoplanes sp. (strain N902-109) TaxID=649831 RepID=UPI000329595C|nr:ATP-binding protein [Actinoplanes sp. N902-109]AGL14826.1 putative anti-sigma regulatory factor, serine/threonine protein kinase [Actinoplanes sp. N902-109]